MNPEDYFSPSPAPIAPGVLTLAVRAFIARVDPEHALERFLEAPGTGPRPLGIERVRRVANGEAEPTLRMAEVVFDEVCRASTPPPAAAIPTDPTPPDFTPLPVQPWEEHVHPPQARQPWEERGNRRGAMNRAQQ